MTHTICLYDMTSVEILQYGGLVYLEKYFADPLILCPGTGYSIALLITSIAYPDNSQQCIALENISTSRNLGLPGHIKVALNQGVYIEQDQVKKIIIIIIKYQDPPNFDPTIYLLVISVSVLMCNACNHCKF